MHAFTLQRHKAIYTINARMHVTKHEDIYTINARMHVTKHEDIYTINARMHAAKTRRYIHDKCTHARYKDTKIDTR